MSQNPDEMEREIAELRRAVDRLRWSDMTTFLLLLTMIMVVTGALAIAVGWRFNKESERIRAIEQRAGGMKP